MQACGCPHVEPHEPCQHFGRAAVVAARDDGGCFEACGAWRGGRGHAGQGRDREKRCECCGELASVHMGNVGVLRVVCK